MLMFHNMRLFLNLSCWIIFINPLIAQNIMSYPELNLENIWNCLAEHAAELKELRSYQSGIETLAAKAKILVKEWGGTRNRPKCYETEYMVTNLRRKTLPGTGRYGMGDQWYIWTDSHGKETRKKDTNFIKWEAI